MSGKMRARARATTQIYSLINMKKILPFALRLTNFVLVVQYQGSALLSEFLKKNGGSGEEYFLKMEKYLENLPSIEAKNNGPKLGRA